MSAPAHSMFERRLHALIAGLVLLGVALVLTLVVAADRTDPLVQGVDERWLARVSDIRTPWLTRVAKTMSMLGSPLVMVPLRLAVIGALAWRRRWLQLGAFLGATVTSELCIGPLKALIDRPRPPGAMVASHSSAFPSGHAIASSVTAIGLVVVLVPAANRRTRWTIVAAVFALVMAMSRTYLGAHWLSDVIASACIGTVLAVVWSAVLELARERHRRREREGVARRTTGTTTMLCAASVALLSSGLAAVVVLHVLRRDLPPAGHRLNEYAIGPYGFVMTAAFVSIGAGLIALGPALAASRRRWSRSVAVTLVAAGVGMVASGIWRTDPDGTGAQTDVIHSRASAFATLALIAAALVWSVPGRRVAVLAAVLGAISPSLHRSSLTGVSQRLLWLTLLAWLILTAWRVWRRVERGVTCARRADRFGQRNRPSHLVRR